MRKEPTPINDFSLLIGHHKSFVFDVIQQPFLLHLNSDPSTMLWFWCIFFYNITAKTNGKTNAKKKRLYFIRKLTWTAPKSSINMHLFNVVAVITHVKNVMKDRTWCVVYFSTRHKMSCRKKKKVHTSENRTTKCAKMRTGKRTHETWREKKKRRASTRITTTTSARTERS